MAAREEAQESLKRFIGAAKAAGARGALATNPRGAVTWQIASIFVGFSIYLLASRVIVREMTEQSNGCTSGMRRWLTWIALLITAATMMTGDLTVRFALKSAAVFAIAGAGFSYSPSAPARVVVAFTLRPDATVP